MEFKQGQRVRTNEGREGVVRYIGGLHIAPGEWLGLELPDSSGKNDGSVKGERYFTCKPGYGIFVREGAIVEILKPVATTATKANGSATAPVAATRPRPSSTISADVARKRQSLMSNGSGSAAGSRLSTRSPTKSPVKPAVSTTSSPRTGVSTTKPKSTDTSNRSRLSISGRPSLAPQNGTARPATHVSRPSIGASSGLRSSATPRATAPAQKSVTTGLRALQPSRSIPKQEKPSNNVSSKATQPEKTRQSESSIIDEEIEESEEQQANTNGEETQDEAGKGKGKEEADVIENDNQSPVMEPSTMRNVSSSSRIGGSGHVEARTAQQREIEQLKAKIRTLERNRQDDRDKLQQVEMLQNDKDRYEGIIQALQKKLRSNQQELVEVRSKCEEAEGRANAASGRSGEHESEIELATLDKEMAEERAETYQMELEALKTKHEELELEVEILREENTELASTMSPEEKASAGWLQMEREKERLRDALLQLRDMSQENESNLKAEIDELRESLDESEKTATLYSEAADRLTRAEETNKHLMGQLEAAETNDEVVEAMEMQREQHLKSIERLKTQIQDLEEHIQVAEELELFHVDEEKRLHAQLDESEALVSDSQRRSLEQERVVEDLEYTLTKFRDVVQGLQSDIDELRRSREISEMQANEMSFKSRAMMDLNLRLQNNAAKTQTKFIDTELNKVQADTASKHVDILSLFLPEVFDADKRPILTLLAFGRVRSKAKLVGKMLGERLRERSHLSNGEEIFKSFETVEHMKWISETCQRFETYMSSCNTQEFAACSSALVELEPVERTVTTWIEALRKDELANNESEHLRRMQGVLTDLSEKLIAEDVDTKAAEALAQTGMVENYTDSIGGQLTAIARLVQSRLGTPKSEDEESMVFDKKMDQLVTRARTLKYLSSKVVQQLGEKYVNYTYPEESSWLLFEEAEQAAEMLTRQVRKIGVAVVEELSKIDSEDAVSYTSIPNTMSFAIQQTSEKAGGVDDPFTFLLNNLVALQSLVEDLQGKASEANSTTDHETRPAPWMVRAKEIKSAKLIPPEIQDELTKLERRNVELGSKIAERERLIEEMSMRVEIAEKRFKESKEKDNKDKALQDEIDALKDEKQANDKTISELRAEIATTQHLAEITQAELEGLKKISNSDDLTAVATAAGTPRIGGGKADESAVKQFELEANMLQAEIVSLQAAVRRLRKENRDLSVPVSEVLIESAKNSWLDSDLSKSKQTVETVKKLEMEREGLDIWSGLIEVAKKIKPVRLLPADQRENTRPSNDSAKFWQPVSQTTRYAVLKQREELEQWEALREDFVKRARIASTGIRTSRARTHIGKTGSSRFAGDDLNGYADVVGMLKKNAGLQGPDAGPVKILEV